MTRDGKRTQPWRGDSVGVEAARMPRHDPDVIGIGQAHDDIDVTSGECVNQTDRNPRQCFRRRTIARVIGLRGSLSAG